MRRELTLDAAPPPISTRDRVEVRPNGKGTEPVYFLKVPGKLDIFELRRRLTELGLRRHSLPDKLRVIRQELRDKVVDGEAWIEEVVDPYEDQMLESLRYKIPILQRLAEASEADQPALIEQLTDSEAPRVDPEIDREMAEVFEQMTRHSARYRALIADDEAYASARPYVVAQMFLTGWEGRKTPFAAVGGRVTTEALDTVPDQHLALIASRYDALVSPSEDQEKNSASPSGSSSGRRLSPSARKPRTAAKGGKSAAKPSPSTRRSRSPRSGSK